MKLSEYNKKRDFNKTAEPQGKVKKSGKELHFVVQKHDASRLHYDFRLEIEGVLVSWAVPKGPSADISVKRLAMHVEDHPMDYIDFEGTIPQGQYGGGTVMVWDTGTFFAEGSEDYEESEKLLKKMYKEGNIKVEMNGSKLKGAYHLIHMKGKDKEWLLMKSKDKFANKKEFDQHSVLTGRTLDEIENDKKSDVWFSNKDDKSQSRKASKAEAKEAKIEESLSFSVNDVAGAKKIKSFPTQWRPQLATLADEVFDNDEWVFENKFDGYRTLIQIHNGKVDLISRNGISFNNKYSELVKMFDTIKEDVILDGEIVVEDEKGNSKFQWLQYYQDNPDQGKLKCYIFDILYFNGFDLTGIELLQRKKILEALIPRSNVVIYSNHITGKGTKALKEAEKNHREGLIAKKAASVYLVNKRSKDWLKIKISKEQEMVIGGYTDPQGSRLGFGALLLGYYDGNTLIYSGKVGTGFNDDLLKDLLIRLKKLERKTSPFKIIPNEKNAHWVKPKLVAQIKYSEWTETGSLRHPVFIGLRDDKEPKEVKKETSAISTLKKQTKMKAKDSEKANGFDTKKVEITNPDKIFWPKEHITKGDVIDYYNEMAKYVLPYVIDRPQSLRRTPDGITKEGFFQKNVEGMVPDWIKTRRIKSKSTGESIEYLLCQDKETLIYMANWGCIEINPWSSRIGSINNPDYIIFDLDPNEASMKDLVVTAKKVKEILDGLGIKGYLKTSGGKGLHVFIPIKPKYTYDQTREFSLAISQAVNNALPKITSLERSPAKRKGKIYLDFLQNGKGKTMACAYSLRPREGATVSTPLEWDELTTSFNIKDYTINTVPERVKHKGDLWENFFNDAVDMKTVLDKIR